MPHILFEGDHAAPARLSGPGEKFALAAGSPEQVEGSESGQLPEGYGTGRLFVTPRDPHWLYAHWDFTREQQRRFNAHSAHGHLILRTYIGAPQGKAVSENHVHPESRHWFAHVERAATEYVAELGYYRRDHKWTRVATSTPTLTPPDTISPATAVSFATIPVDRPLAELLASVKGRVPEDLPLAPALETLRQRGRPKISGMTGEDAAWTPERERALAEVMRTDTSPCAWMDSLAISELMQGWEQAEEQVCSPGEAWSAGAVESISSPSGGLPSVKGFWFKVNAELVIHGATERDATVKIAGRQIALRPDGTFSVRFALPDGQYELAVVAVCAEGTDGRAAELKFTRATEYVGEVETHPQEPGLKPPAPENA